MKRKAALIAVTCALALVGSAAASSPLSGSFQTTIKGKAAQLNGIWVMSFAPNGLYTIAKKPNTGAVLIKGSSTIAGKDLVLRDSSGPLACKGASAVGEYSFSLAGKTLKLTKTKDTCSGRLAVLTTGSWTKS